MLLITKFISKNYIKNIGYSKLILIFFKLSHVKKVVSCDMDSIKLVT